MPSLSAVQPHRGLACPPAACLSSNSAELAMATPQPGSIPSADPTQAHSSDPADLLLQYFPETAKLSREDLEELLRSPAYFDAFFGILPQTLAMYKEHEELLKANEELVAKNMALRERHEALKKETMDAFNNARSLQHRWHNEIVPAQDEVYKRFAPKLQLSRLRTATSDQDRLSEQLVQSLLNGSVDMDDFSSQYKEVRKLYYKRALQTEKFEKGQVDWRE